MRIFGKRLISVIVAALLSLAAQRQSLAGSATWSQNPTTNDWNTAANWVPNTVPNSSSDTASFSTSDLTYIAISARTEISGLNFSPGANSFTISAQPGVPLIISGTGIINASDEVQTFVSEVDGGFIGALFFENSATAGEMTSFTGPGGAVFFNDSASAGSATFNITSGGLSQAHMDFWDNTTAGDATILASDSAAVGVFGNASGGNAVFTVTTHAFLSFGDNATAEHAVATCMGGNGIYGSSIDFQPVCQCRRRSVHRGRGKHQR